MHTLLKISKQGRNKTQQATSDKALITDSQTVGNLMKLATHKLETVELTQTRSSIFILNRERNSTHNDETRTICNVREVVYLRVQAGWHRQLV